MMYRLVQSRRSRLFCRDGHGTELEHALSRPASVATTLPVRFRQKREALLHGAK